MKGYSFHSSDYEEKGLLACNPISSDGPTFWRNISPPSSVSKNKPSKKAAEGITTYLLLLVSCLAYSLAFRGRGDMFL
jgi:hypothetical protein